MILKVVEAFSGIGSQTKALGNIGANHKIVATIEWDINAICAYDLIHNGKPDLSAYKELDKKELIEILTQYKLSSDGKKPLKTGTLKAMSADGLRRILCAIHRNGNLVSITDTTAELLPKKIDLLTYSFPCQDLSICGSWHGNMSGIDRDVHNRSGMLWEIERILKEHTALKRRLPRFLLMENVSNILSKPHRNNFEEWKNYLDSVGYINKVYTLDACNFGIPQHRVRTYMLSIQCRNNFKIKQINKYFKVNDLENVKATEIKDLSLFLRTDYNTNNNYRIEADTSNPNFTPSRQRIFKENIKIFDGIAATCSTVNTITTKQDRNPNSGLLIYSGRDSGKAPYRNLTPRECFLLMGFDENDFQVLMDNDFAAKKGQKFFTREKLIKMAGNSIVVDVLERIFTQLLEINDTILKNYSVNKENKELIGRLLLKV